MLFDNNEFNYEKLLEEMRKVSNAILKYEFDEAIIFRNKEGKIQHTTPEMLEIDTDTIFEGLEETIKEITNTFKI
jgi:hypothetical protein